jgi:hypothetical protein
VLISKVVRNVPKKSAVSSEFRILDNKEFCDLYSNVIENEIWKAMNS